jgi:hypothetical protein
MTLRWPHTTASWSGALPFCTGRERRGGGASTGRGHDRSMNQGKRLHTGSSLQVVAASLFAGPPVMGKGRGRLTVPAE